MDRLQLRGMVFNARHGMLAAEREVPNRFVVDVELRLDLARAGGSDRVEDTIDYRAIYDTVGRVMAGPPAALIEHLAAGIAQRLLAFEQVAEVTVAVAKRPPIEAEVREVRVEITRTRP